METFIFLKGRYFFQSEFGMAHQHNSSVLFIFLNIINKRNLVVNLGPNQMYIFSSNTLFDY